MREKAKSLVALLKDDERLRNERVRALKAKERFAQSAVGIGSDTVNRDPDADQSQVQPPAMVDVLAATASEIDAARPHTAGEEELQLQVRSTFFKKGLSELPQNNDLLNESI